MTENLHRNILHNIFIFALLHEVQAILCNKSSTPLLPFAHTLQMLVLQQNSWLHYVLFFFEYDWIFLEKQWLHLFFHSCLCSLFRGSTRPLVTKGQWRTCRTTAKICWFQLRWKMGNGLLKVWRQQNVFNFMYFQDYFPSWFLGMAHVAYEKITQKKTNRVKLCVF